VKEKYIVPVIFGQKIGIIKEGKRGVEFQYFKDFDGDRLNISPIKLPFQPDRVFNYYDSMAFDGLPGVFADSLPDSFGNVLMQRFFERKGLQGHKLSIIDKLSYMGSKAVGAIEYHPPEGENFDFLGIEFREYVQKIRKVIEGSAKEVIQEEILRHPSPGGARPKASVIWDRGKDIMKAGDWSDNEANGYEHWIVKFDEKGKELTKIEYVYFELARQAGLTTPETALIEMGGETHFAIKRFDRNFKGERKLHRASLAGLLHKDFMEAGLVSYEDFFRLALQLSGSYEDVKEAFRRMVFNVIGRNCDDHIKNVSFLMDSKGNWELSPAYDLIYSLGAAAFGQHKMSINGKTFNIKLNDLAQCGYEAGLDREFMKEAIENISDAFSSVAEKLKNVGVSKNEREGIQKNILFFSTSSFPDRKLKNRKRKGSMNRLAKKLLR